MIRQAFQQQFQYTASVAVRAPGRVNLIGEHTDYNDGYVLPVAIDFQIQIAAHPRSDRQVHLYSLNFERATSFSLDNITFDSIDSWSNYIRGVAFFLEKTGYSLSGIDAVIYGDVPIGAGLSSSAALEVATATAFERINNFNLGGREKALLCQKAENEFVGMNCGIMDQFISCLGEADHALLIDCRSLEYKQVPLNLKDAYIVIGDTNKQRGLVDSEYNTRRQECEEAVRIFAQTLPHVRALRDVTPEQFHQLSDQLPPIVRKRAKHVVFENERVLQAESALHKGDLEEFGHQMNASHSSLRHLYQVSCFELDTMVELARNVPGVFGARMTGAGFGGCIVSIVQAENLDRFKREVGKEYRLRTGLEPKFYTCRASGGTSDFP
ncbi:MAG: galactokinase [Candidatus Hermodarchaeota archaeon]